MSLQENCPLSAAFMRQRHSVDMSAGRVLQLLAVSKNEMTAHAPQEQNKMDRVEYLFDDRTD